NIEGLKQVLSLPVLRAITISTLLQHLSIAAFFTLIILFVTRDLGIKPGIQGVIYAMGGVSSLSAAMLATRSTRRFGLGPTMILGLTLMGISMIFVALAHGSGVVAIAFLVAQQLFGDGGLAVYRINQTSLCQAMVPNHLMGRVTGALRVVGLGAM